MFPQLLHLVDLLFGLYSPKEVKAGCILQLPCVREREKEGVISRGTGSGRQGGRGEKASLEPFTI